MAGLSDLSGVGCMRLKWQKLDVPGWEGYGVGPNLSEEKGRGDGWRDTVREGKRRREACGILIN